MEALRKQHQSEQAELQTESDSMKGELSEALDKVAELEAILLLVNTEREKEEEGIVQLKQAQEQVHQLDRSNSELEQQLKQAHKQQSALQQSAVQQLQQAQRSLQCSEVPELALIRSPAVSGEVAETSQPQHHAQLPEAPNAVGHVDSTPVTARRKSAAGLTKAERMAIERQLMNPERLAPLGETCEAAAEGEAAAAGAPNAGALNAEQTGVTPEFLDDLLSHSQVVC